MEILYLLLVIHLLFDYGIQNENTINKRTKNIDGSVTLDHCHVLLHGLTQMSPVFLLFLFNGIRWHDFIIVTVALLTHLGIDYAKLHFKIKLLKPKTEILKCLKTQNLKDQELLNKHNKLKMIHKKDVSLYVIDQFLHFLVILFIFIYLGTNLITGSRLTLIDSVFLLEVLSYTRYLLALLLIGSFFNVSFKIMTQDYKPLDSNLKSISSSQKTEDKEASSNLSVISPKKAGAVIGTLERILVLLALMASSYIVIGYIIAAKSIARFEKLKDKAFAEYYLIGTFSSLIWSILVFYAFLN